MTTGEYAWPRSAQRMLAVGKPVQTSQRTRDAIYRKYLGDDHFGNDECGGSPRMIAMLRCTHARLHSGRDALGAARGAARAVCDMAPASPAASELPPGGEGSRHTHLEWSGVEHAVQAGPLCKVAVDLQGVIEGEGDILCSSFDHVRLKPCTGRHAKDSLGHGGGRHSRVAAAAAYARA